MKRPITSSFALIALVACIAATAEAQSLRQTMQDLAIIEVVGRDSVWVGDVETYRVKVNEPRDVEYRWTADGDNTALGNPIVHRFQYPGAFDVILTARNVRSTVSDTFSILVFGPNVPRPARAVEARQLRRSSEVGAERRLQFAETQARYASTQSQANSGNLDVDVQAPADLSSTRDAGLSGGSLSSNARGFTWIIATYFERPSAVALANTYRASGYRSGVIADNAGQGSQVYRVVLGEFDTQEKALLARQQLINAGHKNIILREL